MARTLQGCLSLSKERKAGSTTQYVAEGRSSCKLGDSANANGGRLGWREGPHPERSPGPKQANHRPKTRTCTTPGSPDRKI